MFKGLFRKLSKDIGIDLGSSNTRFFIKDKGVVINESSVVAINNKTGQILEVGREALKMQGKTPPFIKISQPLVDGVISDFEVTEKMLKYFIDKIHRENFMITPRPRVVIGIPLDVTEVEKKAVEDAVISAGGRDVFLVENVIAGAVGARMPIQDASGNMIIDIGGGVTEIAVISLSGVVAWKSLKIAGDELNLDIVSYMRDEFNLLIGERVAESIKIKIGSFKEISETPQIRVRGRDLLSGLPKEVLISSLQVLSAIDRSIKSIIEAVKSTLEITPPELVADIYHRGIILIGGGALLKNIDKAIASVVKIPVRIIDDPLTCVVRGTGMILEDENLLKEVVVPSTTE